MARLLRVGSEFGLGLGSGLRLELGLRLGLGLGVGLRLERVARLLRLGEVCVQQQGDAQRALGRVCQYISISVFISGER